MLTDFYILQQTSEIGIIMNSSFIDDETDISQAGLEKKTKKQKAFI